MLARQVVFYLVGRACLHRGPPQIFLVARAMRRRRAGHRGQARHVRPEQRAAGGQRGANPTAGGVGLPLTSAHARAQGRGFRGAAGPWRGGLLPVHVCGVPRWGGCSVQ